jgi:hypothetical protein
MARRAFAVSDAVRERVRYLAGLGVRQDDIAKIIGCAPKTLRKRFRDELDRGVAEANATISGYLFAAAKAGNIAAIIFWLKTRAHWREGAAPNDPISRTTGDPNAEVVVVLPDNSRDPELTQTLREAQERYFSRKPRSQVSELRT